MKTLQYVSLAVIAIAGIAGAICALEYLPLGVSILPFWLTEWLPTFGGAAAGWLIFGIIATIVIAALLIAVVNRALYRDRSSL